MKNSIHSMCALCALAILALSGCASTPVPQQAAADAVIDAAVPPAPPVTNTATAVSTAATLPESAAGAVLATAAPSETKASIVVDDSLADSAEAVLVVDAPNPDVLICRRMQKTGSRFVKKVCGTREEWDEMKDRTRHDRAFLESLQRNSRP